MSVNLNIRFKARESAGVREDDMGSKRGRTG
jgi:hypothetical protein